MQALAGYDRGFPPILRARARDAILAGAAPFHLSLFEPAPMSEFDSKGRPDTFMLVYFAAQYAG